ncbi:MAG: FtsW/RodA/SpoVE family cell cycle protein [Blautia sp.]
MDENVILEKSESKKKVNLLFRNIKKGKPVGRFAERVHYYDYNLVAVVVLLTCFGLIMLYSTSAYVASVKEGNDMFYFLKQTILSLLSIAGAIYISRFDYHILFQLSFYIALVSLVLMAMVRYTPLGVEVNGARRWIRLGIQFQPSEVAKIAVITFVPCLIVKMGRFMQKRAGMILLFGTGVVLAGGAFYFTDNLSTGIIIGGMTVLIIFLAHPKSKTFIIIGIALLILIVGGIVILHLTLGQSTIDIKQIENFRIRRVMVWLQPERYAQSGGYQIMQAMYAIGSGGFFGKGLGNSVQKLGAVPEAQNDMIFSIICEELGVFGCMIILLLFAYLMYRLIFIAQNAPDLYGSLMVCGIFFHIALQVILNICVVINLIPTTGITLPFFSYGGTSIVFLMAEMGIALSVSGQIKFEEQKRVDK